MSLPITSTPQILDGVNLSTSYQQQITTAGPFLIGTDIWQMAFYQSGFSPTPNEWGLYKNGVEIGIATKPYPNDIAIPGPQVLVSGTKITVLAQHVTFGSPIFIVEFDTVAGTYGTPIVLGGVTGGLGNALFYKRASDGAYVVIGRNPVTNSNGIWYNIISGGVWGSYTVIDGAENPIIGGAVDSGDNVHACFRHGTSLLYRFISNAFVANIGVTITGSFDFSTQYTPIQVLASSVAIAYTDNASMFVSIGTPLSNPVTFVPSTLQTTGVGEIIWYPALGMTNASQLAAMWAFGNTVDMGGGGGSPVVDVLQLSIFNGTSWSAPTLVYDEVANPPSPSLIPPPKTPDTNELEGTGFLQRPSGSWVISIGIDTHTGFTDWEPTFILENTAGPPPTLTLMCPTMTMGTIGSPYSSSFTASGGTPPYTFAITMGMLPPGLSLNTSTGAITGTPTTAGGFSFVGQLTDSGSPPQVVTVACTITIPGSGPTPPPPGPPPFKCPTGTWTNMEGSTPPAFDPNLVLIGRAKKS